MTEPAMGPRDYVNAEFTRRAWQDEAFRDELLRDPRGVVERELGVRLPAHLKLNVHEETPDELHFILPPRPSALKDAVTGPYDLADRDVQGFVAKADDGTGTSSCHACVGGVRG
jgi:hypothetical protein